MQATQRVFGNHALIYALWRAKQENKQLLVAFVLSGSVGAELRHYWFMIQGLREVWRELERQNIAAIMVLDDAKTPGGVPAIVARLTRIFDSRLVVCDMGYLRWQRVWRERLQEELSSQTGVPGVELVEIESDLLVPVGLPAPKQEWSAASLRPKLHRLLPAFIAPPRSHGLLAEESEIGDAGPGVTPIGTENTVPNPALSSKAILPRIAEISMVRGDGPVVGMISGISLIDPDRISNPEILSGMLPGISQKATTLLTLAGRKAAIDALYRFFDRDLERYSDDRSDPSLDIGSRMSAFLHYGHIGIHEIVSLCAEYCTQWGFNLIADLSKGKAVRDNAAAKGGTDRPLDLGTTDPSAAKLRVSTLAFIEELVVRRELAFNYVYFQPEYDRYAGIPSWARKTLDAHRKDKRPYLYSFEQLESADTHDRYWNAAQNQMLRSGYMHNYMRMYWGKKILEWSPDPAEALEWINRLNDRWELDGRDPNGYTGAAWCLGLHDRPWTERPVFGTVRYMNAAGLERKFDIKTYAARWK